MRFRLALILGEAQAEQTLLPTPILKENGILQITIIPAVATTYYGLVAKDTQQNMTPINWDNMEKLKGNEQGVNVNKYIQQQQKKVEELQNKYLSQ